MDQLGADRVGEGLDRFIIIADRDGDAVFRAFQLRLELQEILVGLEVGIGLDRGEQAAKALAQLCLGGLILRDLGGIGQVGGVDLDRGRLGAGFGHGGQRRLFLLAGGLDRGDEVAGQVGAALILRLDVSPFGLGIFLGSGDAVDAAGGQRKRAHDRQQKAGEATREKHGTSSALFR
ncbi:hypothetical protein LTR94_003054 [Friedmanniomyces endolithicus]|nr:hypothetical protein LTR94_003054 [Friedmanniomyces endolithicus]